MTDIAQLCLCTAGESTTRPPEADEDEPEDVPQNSEATTASEACQGEICVMM